MLNLQPAASREIDEITGFLRDCDLTVSGLDAPSTRLWTLREPAAGKMIALTGFELSSDGADALIRSVAVHPEHRGHRLGHRLAQFAVDEARCAGASRAWLFSRRSGGFWQKLGFTSTDVQDLASALESTHQVKLFTQTGQLLNEVAWTRPLEPHVAD